MRLLTWNESFSVKIKILDDQHRKLIGIINRIYSLNSGSDKCKFISPLVQRLLDESAVHFFSEEDYFQKYHYPYSHDHICEHRDYSDKLQTFLDCHAGNQNMLYGDLLNFLDEWWINHILSSDQKYAAYFDSHGLTQGSSITISPLTSVR